MTEEIEAQIIGDLLPDDGELLSDVLDEVGYAAYANNGEDVDDDIFCTGGGMELETDENKKLQEFNGGSNDGLGFLNGAPNGEHPHGEHPSRTLFVRNINSNVEDSELKLIFEVLLFTYVPTYRDSGTSYLIPEIHLLFPCSIMETSVPFTLHASIVVL